MSTYWFLHCVTCDGFERKGDRGPGNVNHGAEYLASIIPALPLIAQLSGVELDVSLSNGDNRAIVEFAVEHHSHEVQVLNEYGAFWNECSESVQCACGRWEPCALDKDHTGSHTPRRLLAEPAVTVEPVVEVPHIGCYRGPTVAKATRIESGVKISEIGYYDEEIVLTHDQLRRLGLVDAK